MGILMGQLIGATLILLLLGSLFAFILKSLMNFDSGNSRLFGVLIACLLSITFYLQGNPQVPPEYVVTVYSIGALFAWGILFTASLRKALSKIEGKKDD